MNLQFTSNVRSSINKPYTINIYSTNGYTGSTINISVNSCVVTRQNSSIFDPIISSGCKIEFINNLSSTDLEQLFNNYDKSYLLELIDVNEGITIFKGYLSVDIIEKSLDYQSTLLLEFSDYLKKMNETTSDKVDGDYIYLSELVDDCLTLTGINQPIIINSSLHSNNSTVSASTTYLVDNLIDTNNFIDGDSIDNCKDVASKILTPFNSYLYSFNNNYYIQNYLDIDNTSTRNWLKIISGMTYANASDKQVLTENDYKLLSGAFINYEAGLAEFDLNLKQKLYDNLIYNNFDTEIDVNFTGIVPTNQARGQWYYYQPSTGYTATFGNGWGDIQNYIYVKFPIDYVVPIGSNYWTGDYFFGKKCRIALDRTEDKPQNTLSLEGVVRRNILADYVKEQQYCLPFSIKILSGVNKGKYVKIDTDGSTILYSNVVGGVYEDIPRVVAYGSFISTDTTVKCSTTVDFTNLLYDFGSEVDVDILILFHQYYFQLNSDHNEFGTRYYNSQLIGNVKASYLSSLDDNYVNTELSTNYTKTISQDLHIFDTSNSNYTNSLYTNDNNIYYNRTQNWKSDIWTNDQYKPLYQKYLQGVLNFYLKTRENLKCRIQTSIPIRPLSIIELTSGNKKYFIHKINHDIGSDIYQIEGYELGYEDINITE